MSASRMGEAGGRRSPAIESRRKPSKARKNRRASIPWPGSKPLRAHSTHAHPMLARDLAAMVD